MQSQYSVWVGGSEINDYPLTKSQANRVAQNYIKKGYDDVVIECLNNGIEWLNSTGYLASLVLMCLAVLGLFTGDISAGEFIACILCGTATGVYFVYREMKGE